jgi:dihydrofolate synthase/folylpolyglutamate synthase
MEKIPVREQTIRAGLSSVKWPGRLQLLNRPSGQKFLLDGAHNTAGAETLATALKEYFPSAHPALILGILQDKDWTGICRILAPLASRIILAPVTSERTAAPEELQRACQEANPATTAIACQSLAEALSVVTQEKFVAITGSLYLVGEALEMLDRSNDSAASERELNEWGNLHKNG